MSSRAEAAQVAGINIQGIATAVALAAIAATAFLYNNWTLDPRVFFFADDWNWIFDSKFHPWNPLYSILPEWVPNDRPVGVAILRLFYDWFGLNPFACHVALLCLHAVNCLLLYALAVRYTGRSGAVLAALLSAVWFTADGALAWTAGIFDIFGATLCLLTLVLRQLALRSSNGLLYDFAGAASYFIAMRTKEFAFGSIALLFLMTVLLERQTIKATLKQLAPYLAVFVVFAIRYAQLISNAPAPPDDPYHLNFSAAAILGTFGYYVRELFCGNNVADPMISAAVVIGLGVGLLRANANAQRIAVLGFAGFVVMLAPALLLPAHLDALYLYAPHFFFTLIVGGLAIRKLVPAALAVLASIAIIATPIETNHRFYVIGYYRWIGESDQTVLNAAVALLSPLPRKATVFITGVEPALNVFTYGPGLSLKVLLDDEDLEVVTAKPGSEVVAKFCATPGEKRFLRFEGTKGSDETGVLAASCDQRKKQG